MSHFCRQCGKELIPDEIAVTKKLMNRGATSFLCIPCLAEYFSVSQSDIRERIEYFKASGCTLFEAPEASKAYMAQEEQLP